MMENTEDFLNKLVFQNNNKKKKSHAWDKESKWIQFTR